MSDDSAKTPKPPDSTEQVDAEVIDGPPPAPDDDGMAILSKIGEAFQHMSVAQVQSATIEAGVRKAEIEAQSTVHIKVIEAETAIQKRNSTTGRIGMLFPAGILALVAYAYINGDPSFAKDLLTYIVIGGGGSGFGYAIGHRKGAESAERSGNGG